MKLPGTTSAPLAVLAAVLLLTACDNPEQKEARYIRLGNAAFDQDMYEKARVDYKNAARVKPADAEPFYRLGLVDEAEGDLRNAFVQFTSAEQQNAHFHPAALKLAHYYIGGEQYAEAEKRLSAVLADTPDDAEAHALLASLWLHENKGEEAEKEGRIALGKDPGNITATAALAGLYTARQAFDQAIATTDAGITHHPDNVPLLILRAMIYGSTDDLPHLAETYQTIFKLQPDAIKFRTDLANIYVKAGKLDEAEATLRAGIAARPNDWEIKHALIFFLDQHRGMAAAEQEIRKAMRDNADLDEPYFWLADLYAGHDAPDRAIELLNQIVGRGKTDAALNARVRLALLDIKRGNKDHAEKLVATVLAKAPDDQAALFVRANLFFDSGDYQNAVSDLHAILRAAPQAEDALRLLGETLLLQGHADLAIDVMGHLVDSAPDNDDAKIRLAQMLYARGNIPMAMDLIGFVTKTAPNNAVAWETAARFAIDSGQWLAAEEAIRTLDRLPGQHLTAVFLEGRVLEKTSQNEAALDRFSEIAKADPHAPLAEHALKELMETYRKLGRIDAACDFLQNLKSDSAFVATLLGNCYTSIGKTGESATLFDNAIAAKAAFPEPYIARAELYLQNHQSELALDILKQGIAAAPRDIRMPMMLADILTKQGRYQEASAVYLGILDHNPGYNPAANNLAELIADYQSGDTEALEKARQIAERFAGSTDPIQTDTLAWVYFRQGKTQLAQTMIERAMTKPQTDLPPQIHYHYAMILMKNGKPEQAEAELRQATVKDADYPGLAEAQKLAAKF